MNKENYIEYCEGLKYDIRTIILNGAVLKDRKVVLEQCRAVMKTLEEWVGDKEFDAEGIEELKSLLVELHCREEMMVKELGAVTYDRWSGAE